MLVAKGALQPRKKSIFYIRSQNAGTILTHNDTDLTATTARRMEFVQILVLKPLETSESITIGEIRQKRAGKYTHKKKLKSLDSTCLSPRVLQRYATLPEMIQKGTYVWDVIVCAANV